MNKYILGLFSISFILLPFISFAQAFPIPEPYTTECISIVNDLRYRDRDINKNGEVSTLQDFLQGQGYLNSEPTGYFGLLTVRAVKNFQRNNGINPDGKVGLTTKTKIKNLTCNGNVISTPSLTLIYPSGGETFSVGQKIKVRWTSEGIARNEKITARINWDGVRDGFGYGTLSDFSLGINDGEEDIIIPEKAYSSNPQMNPVSFAELGTANLYIFAPNVLIWSQNINCLNGTACMPGPTYPESSTRIPFRIISSIINSSNVIISGISGPQSLNVNQAGTWTVNAYDNNGGNLSYYVDWGDGPEILISSASSQIRNYQQSATFTHSYLWRGNFMPKFIVTNSSGKNATTSLNVNIW